MDFTDFLRVDRAGPKGQRFVVVHTRHPRFSVEIAPDVDAEDHVGKGVIKRLCIPNSVLGDYSLYSSFLTAAQEFFRETFFGAVAAKPKKKAPKIERGGLKNPPKREP